jgi:hypothetical protein
MPGSHHSSVLTFCRLVSIHPQQEQKAADKAARNAAKPTPVESFADNLMAQIPGPINTTTATSSGNSSSNSSPCKGKSGDKAARVSSTSDGVRRSSDGGSQVSAQGAGGGG